MCKHTTTIFICGHRERDMLPTGPSCVFGNLHAHGPNAVFHVSKVARICPRCEKGNDERAERAGAGLERVSGEEEDDEEGRGGVLMGAKQGESAGLEAGEEDEDDVEDDAGEEVEGEPGSSRKKGFYWGRDSLDIAHQRSRKEKEKEDEEEEEEEEEEEGEKS